ncbi:asparagine synthetase B [Deltaproteobacteria bacterium]|nr:asparagine synthetase B [Deltaproteobacteria bacterium]
MGGISGIVNLGGAVDDGDARSLGAGPRFRASGAIFVARPRSTLAHNEQFAVMVAGHFDRAPATGQSAAEVVLDGWQRSGMGVFSQVEGAWVAAVYERATEKLTLVRDPFGVRRLFWSTHGNRLAFASGMRALLDVPGVSRELARENLAEFLSFRYVHAPRTLLRDVRALPPGHMVTAEPGRPPKLEPWFRLRHAPPYSPMPPDEETLAEIERRLFRAVAARSTGKERVGVFLSGGLDSSAISWVASRLGPVSTFTVGVQDGEDDEAPYAGRVATILRAKHEVVRVSPEAMEQGVDAVVEATDAPVTDPAAIPQYLLGVAARQSVDVVLCGDGGDEIFGGRMVGVLASQLRLSTWLRRLPGAGRRLVGAAFGDKRPEIEDDDSPFGLARVVGGVVAFDKAARRDLMRDPGWVREGIRRACLEPFYREVVSDPINEILHAYLRGRMPEDALARTGAVAQAADLGVRAPLLDRDLVGFCANIPGPWKVRPGLAGSVTKWPLRELLRPVLTRPLVSRPKRVLPGPWKRWFEGPMEPFLRARVSLLREDPLRLFMPGAIDALVPRVGQPGVAERLWTLIFLDAWVRSVGAT